MPRRVLPDLRAVMDCGLSLMRGRRGSSAVITPMAAVTLSLLIFVLVGCTGTGKSSSTPSTPVSNASGVTSSLTPTSVPTPTPVAQPSAYQLTHTTGDAEYILNWDLVVRLCPDVAQHSKLEAFAFRGQTVQLTPQETMAIDKQAPFVWDSTRIVRMLEGNEFRSLAIDVRFYEQPLASDTSTVESEGPMRLIRATARQGHFEVELLQITSSTQEPYCRKDALAQLILSAQEGIRKVEIAPVPPTPASTPTPTPKRGFTEPPTSADPTLTEKPSTATLTPTVPRPVAEVAFGGVAIVGNIVQVKAAILGPVFSEPTATLDGRSPDRAEMDKRTLAFTFTFRDVMPGEHDVHVSGGNLSHTERITVKPATVRPCTVLPLPAATPVAPRAPTPTPAPVPEIELRRVEAFDTNLRVVFWFGPGGFGSVSLDGRVPDLAPPELPDGEFIFLGVSPGAHTVLAQGYPHRLEIKLTCDSAPSQAPSSTLTAIPTVIAPPPIVRFSVYGTVYDSRQGAGAGIAGAVVVGQFGGERSRLTSRTDASGRYEFGAQGHPLSRSAKQPVYLEVTAEGYVRATLTCLTFGSQEPSYAGLYTARCDVGLEPQR